MIMKHTGLVTIERRNVVGGVCVRDQAQRAPWRGG